MQTCHNFNFRCPLYYNLPSMCTLVKKDGECCLQPVCNFNPTVSHFNNTAMATTATGIRKYTPFKTKNKKNRKFVGSRIQPQLINFKAILKTGKTIWIWKTSKINQNDMDWRLYKLSYLTDFISIFQPHVLTNPRCTSKARPGKMDASTSVLALMPPRDSTHVNNCKFCFKNFNVFQWFIFCVSQCERGIWGGGGGTRDGRNNMSGGRAAIRCKSFIGNWTLKMLNYYIINFIEPSDPKNHLFEQPMF